MKDLTGNCRVGSGCWTHRLEVVGVILIAIATCLTVVTANSFGIVMLFLVGFALCCHKCFMGLSCHSHSSEEANCCHHSTIEDEASSPEPIKTPKTGKTSKNDTAA